MIEVENENININGRSIFKHVVAGCTSQNSVRRTIQEVGILMAKEKYITIRIDKDIKAKLNSIAILKKMPLSNYLRIIIENELDYEIDKYQMDQKSPKNHS